MTEWDEAFKELELKIMQHPQFISVVRSMHCRPSGWVPNHRAKRIATIICIDLGRDPNIYRGNVFGAAVEFAKKHS